MTIRLSRFMTAAAELAPDSEGEGDVSGGPQSGK